MPSIGLGLNFDFELFYPVFPDLPGLLFNSVFLWKSFNTT